MIDVSYLSLCTGKTYCPHLKGAHVSPATHSPTSNLHPFHRGLWGGKHYAHLHDALESLPLNGLPLSGKERMEFFFSLFVSWLDWLVGFCLFIYFEPESCSVTQSGMNLTILLPAPPASASWVLGLQVCKMIPSLELFLFSLNVGNVVVSTNNVEV
jgi:hypothetical protein